MLNQELFNEAAKSDYIYYRNGTFEQLCEIFSDPINTEVDYLPVKYTTLCKEEYARFNEECVYPYSMTKGTTGIVIFQDKNGVARFGLWNAGDYK